MLSNDDCKNHFRQYDEDFTDEQIEAIRLALYELAKIEYENSKTTQYDNESSDVHEGVN